MLVSQSHLATPPLVLVLMFAFVGGGAAQTPDATQTPGDEQETIQDPPFMSAATWVVRAQEALRDGDREAAVKAAKALAKQHGSQKRIHRVVADVLLRAGEAEESIEHFNRFIASYPEEVPYLWQRGIAQYFAGDHAGGAKQFEVHREVNPNDVENAAWHFLCVAKDQSPAEAKRLVLPAPNDSRIPMAEVLDMLSSGDIQRVQDRIDAEPKNGPRRRSAEFYGQFYLGLYADAHGDLQKALKHMRKSVEHADEGYMDDVARVYLDYLTQQVKKSKQASEE